MPQPAFEVNLDCYLWDLVDEGIDTALDRIKNETGVTGICLRLHCAALTLLRPHVGVSPREFRTEGGAQFQPDITRYAGTRLRPIVPKWLRKTNPLKAVVESCRRRGLKVAGHIHSGFNPELADRYDHAVVRDVFDEKTTWLCPINPDVQEYLRALSADLSENYELDRLGVGGLGFPHVQEGRNYAFWGEKPGFYLGPVETWLRGLCRCESCRRVSVRDGIDMDAVMTLVRETLEHAYRTGECLQETLGGFADNHPPLAAYLKWRTAQLQQWVMSFRRVCKCQLAVDRHQEPLCSGIDLSPVSEYFDVYETWPGALRPEAIDNELRNASRTCGVEKICLNLSAGSECRDSSVLVTALNRVVKAGCHSASISNYGLIPVARLDWIRQAVRFARRESL